MTTEPTSEPVDLLAALNLALGRAKDDPRVYTSTNAYDDDGFEPPDPPDDYDGFEADAAADRYERAMDARWE